MASLNDGYIELVQGDITRERVDAIVNAANTQLQGGGGVDGAIHRAAGPAMQQALNAIGSCPTGDARITPGFRLPARHVIHAVGPVWQGGNADEDELLVSCYRAAFRIADAYELRSISFCSISTGVYGFPLKRAASLVVPSLRDLADQHRAIHTVRMVTFSEDSYAAYADVLREYLD